MSQLKHNKKRNTGLISEFFARYMAKAIIENRDADLAKAREIFRKHFNRGTDLHRELRLFEALYETSVSNKETANSLIQQVKEACKIQSQKRLDLEKTALLHEINAGLKDANFFDKEIGDFKMYASVQVLLNHWRGQIMSENIREAVQLEDKLIQHLTREAASTKKSDALSMTNEDCDKLVVKIMTEKMNSKFSKTLSGNQKNIVKLYVFSKDNENTKAELTEVLEGIKSRVISQLDFTKRDTTNQLDKITLDKLNEVKSMLLNEYKDTTNPTDEMVTFYLSVSKLEKDLKDE